MKQTPVQWLYDQIGETAPYEYAGQITSYLEQAMKMEQSQAMTLQNQSESKEIPELSDEEIGKAMHKYNITDFGQMAAFQVGAKWYREQLKQRQCQST